MSRFLIGLDLAQSCDFTAIAILERKELKGPWDAVQFDHRKMAGLQLRYLERVPKGTPYPEVVHRVRTVTRSGELSGECSLIVDATGVGRAVVDMLRTGGLDAACRILPVQITSGHSETQVNGYYHVPKKDLIVGLQVLLQRGGLKIAAGMTFAGALVEELTQMRVKIAESGHEQYGAWRSGEHDDLVLAVALGHWGAGKLHWPVTGDDGYWRHQ